MIGRLAPAPVATPTPSAQPAAGNAISTLTLTCRGVNRLSLSPSANSDLAYFVLQNLTNSPYFTDRSAFGADGIVMDAGSNTFVFTLTAELRHPFKL